MNAGGRASTLGACAKNPEYSLRRSIDITIVSLYNFTMNRVSRRMAMLRGRHEPVVDAERYLLEGALRGRTARKVRSALRRLEPVTLRTPRWSAPQPFLERLALDLAVGEPRLLCRTVSFRPMMGRSPAEARNFVLRLLTELWDGGEARPLPIVMDRRGFTRAASDLFEAAHRDSAQAVALLGHGAEHLPVEVLEDLGQAWRLYTGWAGDNRRCTMLISGTVDVPTLGAGTVALELTDLSDAEVAECLIQHYGSIPSGMLEPVVKICGGVPGVLDAMLAGVTQARNLPTNPGDALRRVGGVGEELRGAVQGVMASPDIADRLHQLADGLPHSEDAELDRDLLMVGLARRARQPGPPQVVLRAHLLAAAAFA